MIAFVRRNLSFLIWKHSSPLVCRSPIFFLSPSLPSFATLSEKKLCDSSKLLDILVRKYEFSSESASRLASDLSHLKRSENTDPVLSFLRESGFSNAQLVKIARYRPMLMASRPVSIKPKIKILQELGFSSKDITKMISSNPTILHLSVKKNIIPSISILKGLLGSINKVSRVLCSSSWVLRVNLEDILVPNVEFLKSCGIPITRIRSVLVSYPGSFSMKPEVIRKSVVIVEDMGLSASSKQFIYAIASIARMSNDVWEQKLLGFQDAGFSESDILTMFRKDPRVFSVSIEKVKKVKEIVLATGKFDMSSIVNYPLSLAFSVEKRFKPRLRVISILVSRNLIKEWPSLGLILNLSDERFLNKFVSPYSKEIIDVHLTKRTARSKKVSKP